MGGTSQIASTGGSGTELGTGGSSQTATTSGAPAIGGTSQTAATGGAEATGGTSQTVATGGAEAIGGASQTATTGGLAATGGASQTTAPVGTSSVNNSPVIDAFSSCDDQIERNGGRSGKWYYFADGDYNATHGYGDPGTQWFDHGCSAWILLGCAGTACTYAGIGFQLSEGDPYDLQSYSGVSIAFEGGDDVYFVVKTSNGGYFGAWLAGTTGNQKRNADFADLAEMSDSATDTLDASLITEMQFTVGRALDSSAGFGLAVHSVSLY